MHKALYRKYRPCDFNSVVGQDNIKKILSSQVAENRLSHAYLFTGSRGTGKTSCAKIMAKAVNCVAPINGNPCLKCDICVGIENESIMDVFEIDAASNNGVENVREIRSGAGFSPSVAKYRVYIIDEVHMLSTEAFNALLKILEEPPEHVIFILATTEVHKIPATILSRCQRYDFRRIDSDIIANHLKKIATDENLKITDDAAVFIARLADGAMRDAFSIMDLCINGSDEITEQVVAKTAGLSDSEHIISLIDFISKPDCGKALSLLNELYSAGVDMRRLANELENHSRNLMLINTLGDKNLDSFIALPLNQIKKLKKQAKNISVDKILYMMGIFEETAHQISRGANGRICAEMMIIKLTNPTLNQDFLSILLRLEKLENLVSNGVNLKTTINSPTQETTISANQPIATNVAETNINVVASPPAVSAPPAVSVSETSQPATSSEPRKMENWAEVLERLKSANPMIHAVLVGSSAYISGEILLIDCKNNHFRDLVKEGLRHRDSIREATKQVTGKLYKLGPYVPPLVEKAVESDMLETFISENKSDIILK